MTTMRSDNLRPAQKDVRVGSLLAVLDQLPGAFARFKASGTEPSEEATCGRCSHTFIRPKKQGQRARYCLSCVSY